MHKDKTDPIERSEADECIAVVRKTIADATALELNGNWEKALQKLESVRKEAENILNEAPSTSEHSIRSSINDPRSVKQELLNHIRLCNEKLTLYAEVMAPPSYEEAMSTNTSSASSDYLDGLNLYATMSSISAGNLPYDELGVMLENLKADIGAQSVELIYSCHGATLYFISNSGKVAMSSGPDTVRVFQIAEGDPKSTPKYYLQIYTFVYPLVRNVSPCMRTEFGAILLPNINADQTIDFDYQSIGLMIPKEHEEEFILILENILGTKIIFCDTNKSPSTYVSSKISESIVSGAESVSNFLIQSAQEVGQFMDESTPKIIDKINPSDRQRRVAPCMKKGIKIAKDVTSVTANVTGFMASKVGAATLSLGQFLAPHIRRKGGRILSQTTGMDETRANDKINSVLNLTAGAVESLGTIYHGLETSAYIFGRSLSNNAVQVVKHRYGHPAAEFTQDTFETVSNGIEIGTNVRMFKPKCLTKNTLKGIIGAGCNSVPSTSNQQSKSSETQGESSVLPQANDGDLKPSLAKIESMKLARPGHPSYVSVCNQSEENTQLVSMKPQEQTSTSASHDVDMQRLLS